MLLRASPQKTLNALLAIEIDGSNAPDMRRVIKDERQALQTAMQSGDAQRIARARDEAIRTASLWGREIS